MIPLPRASVLGSAMLLGLAVGLVVGITTTLLITASVRPDLVMALVLGVPSGAGLLLVLFSGRRWMTTLGAFVLSVAPGWFGVLVAIEVVSRA